MQPMANIALRAARKAGDFMLRAMDRPDEFDIETKAPNDFVSNIDKTSVLEDKSAQLADQVRVPSLAISRLSPLSPSS